MLSQVHVALDIFYQHIVYVYWGVVYNHHLCLCQCHRLMKCSVRSLSAALVIVGFGALSIANTGRGYCNCLCLHTLVVRNL